MAMCAMAWGISLDRWDRLDPDTQARHIAVWRAKNQIAAITDHYIVNKKH